AAAGAVQQSRSAMPADIGESAKPRVEAANDDDALAEIFERVIVAGFLNVALMADDLPGRADRPLHFNGKEFAVRIGPCGKAPAILRIGAGRAAYRLCHGVRQRHLPPECGWKI